MNAAERLARDGFVVCAPDPRVADWAAEARRAAEEVLAEARGHKGALRHGETWFAGVDALPNAPDGSIGGVPLTGPWEAAVNWPGRWHRAQVSAVFPGYPGRDPQESDAAHRFRLRRDAAHLDGLLPEGPDRRRHLREPHAFILGLPLNPAAPGASPLVVREGSHRIMAAAMAARLSGMAPDKWGAQDVTEAYGAARRTVLETCPRREVPLLPGQSVLVHRHAIHGVAPWARGAWVEGGARMVAYFRPVLGDPADWLA